MSKIKVYNTFNYIGILQLKEKFCHIYATLRILKKLLYLNER